MHFGTNGRHVLVFLAALCFLHFTDTHSPLTEQRGFSTAVQSSGSNRPVSELLSPTQLESIRNRWKAQRLDSSLLESMLRSRSQEFIRNHQQTAGASATRPLGDSVPPGRRGPRVGPDQPLDRQGGFVEPRGLPTRNLEPHGHEGHNHGGIDQPINGIGGRVGRERNGIGGRTRGIGRPGRGRGLSDVGPEERIPILGGSQGRNVIEGMPTGIDRPNRRDRNSIRGRTRGTGRPGRGSGLSDVGPEERIPIQGGSQGRNVIEGMTTGIDRPGRRNGIGGRTRGTFRPGRGSGLSDVGAEERIPLQGGSQGRRGREPDVGVGERIPANELGGRSGRRPNDGEIQDFLRHLRGSGQPRRTDIDVLGRPTDVTRIPGNGIRGRDRNQIRPRNGGHVHTHGQEHGHGHAGERINRRPGPGDITVGVGNRRRGGVERVDGTRVRTGLDRIRARNQPVVVAPTNNRRRRRRRNRLGQMLRGLVGTFLG